MKLFKKSLVFLFAFVAALSVAMMNDTSASAAELRNSGDTFDQLAAYITDSGTYSGGYYTISETEYSSGSNYYSVYSMSNRGSYIRFSYKVSNLTSSYIGNTLNVDLYRDSRNLSVSFSMNFYQSGSLIDSASKSCTIDRSIYTNEKSYSLYASGTYITSSDFSAMFNSALDILFMHFELELIEIDPAIGFSTLGFLDFGGFTDPICDVPTSYHTSTRTTINERPGSCQGPGYSGDVGCPDCGVVFETGSETPANADVHVLDSVCDQICNHCGHSGLRLAGADLNANGQVNSDDAVYLLYHTLLGNSRYPIDGYADMNQDGGMDSDDAIYLLYHTLLGNSRYPVPAGGEPAAFSHKYAAATCTKAKHCTACGISEGKMLEHSYAPATCAAPKTCKGCGKTEGEALPHASFKPATCTAAKTCVACGTPVGDPLPHNYKTGVCVDCGAVNPNYIKQNVVYQDSRVVISFKEITSRGVVFSVKNKTGVTITIQADTISINKMSTEDITMSDDVAPYSTGDVIARCDDFSTNLSVGMMSGQFRIIDFNDSFSTYNALFCDVILDSDVYVTEPSVPSTLLYSDSRVKIYFKEVTDRGVVCTVQNLTTEVIFIQADAIALNKKSTEDITMSDDVSPHSTGDVIARCDDFTPGMRVGTISGQLRVITDNKSLSSYNARFAGIVVDSSVPVSEPPVPNALIYSDSRVKIYFKEVNKDGMIFTVQNLTDRLITIQNDGLYLNGSSIGYATMSDDVAPYSTGDVKARRSLSVPTGSYTVSGTLCVIDFDGSFKTYDVKFSGLTVYR